MVFILFHIVKKKGFCSIGHLWDYLKSADSWSSSEEGDEQTDRPKSPIGIE